MPSSVKAYSIAITNPGSVSAPGDGFIDNLRIEDYNVGLTPTPSGLNADLGIAKRRGNWRFKEIINQLGLVTNCYVDHNSLPTALSPSPDATIKVEPSSFTFQIYVERGGSLVTQDELNPGAVLVGVDCIIRCVARALIMDWAGKLDVYDPTTSNPTGAFSAQTAPRVGTRIAAIEVGPVADDLATAEGMVEVTDLIPGT